MRQLRMSWSTERGRLVCHWIESSEKPFSFAGRARLSFNPGNQVGDALGQK